jgi:hypothetical protein
METIQYSLNNTNTYSINVTNIISKNHTLHEIKQDIIISKNKNTNNKEIIQNKSKAKINDINNIFDKHCLNLYGSKTCILFYENNYNIEVRLLDKIDKNLNEIIKFEKIKEDALYKIIPFYLEKKYTVVIIKSTSQHKKEITDIHLPPS